MFSKLTVSLPYILILLFAAAHDAYAASNSPGDSLGGFSGPGIGSLVTVIVVLILIIGLIVITIRFLAVKNKGLYGTKSIRHLGGVPVGQNKSVQLMKIGNAVYVIGIGDDVRLLEKIEDQEEIDRLLESMNVTSALPGRGLLNYLQNWAASRRKSTISQESTDHPAASSFQEIFHKKMQQVGQRKERLKDMLHKDEEDSSGGKSL